MAEALDISCEIEVSSDPTRREKRPRKKKKADSQLENASADHSNDTAETAQAQGPPQSQARKRKALLKREKTRIALSLRDLTVEDILSHVVVEVSALCHIKSNPDKAKFWDTFKESDGPR
jgi:hypothetical protein